jgi:hypothetical protein
MYSGYIESFPIMSIETEDSATVEILENCINDDKFAFLKPVELNAYNSGNFININYFQPTNDKYNLGLYDLNGRKIKTLLEDNTNDGDYEFNIDFNDISSGNYILILQYSDKVITRIISITK